jgi:hypothetical protein
MIFSFHKDQQQILKVKLSRKEIEKGMEDVCFSLVCPSKNPHRVMLVCMASYMMVGYEHANHAFKVNVHS